MKSAQKVMVGHQKQRERAENRMFLKEIVKFHEKKKPKSSKHLKFKIFYNLVLRFSSIFIGQSFSLIFCFFRSIKYFYAFYC